MAKYDDISKITVTTTVNHTQNTITVKRTGDRSPIAQACAVSPIELAGAYRAAAAYFLDLAAKQMRMYEIDGAQTIERQATIMLHEHEILFNI
jgi:hypothetical protein